MSAVLDLLWKLLDVAARKVLDLSSKPVEVVH